MDLSKITADIKDIISNEGLIFYSLEYKLEDSGYILRLTIDKKDPVTMDDVSKITDLVNAYLDKEDPIENSYTLEVTSRGIEKEFSVNEASEHLGDYVFIKTSEQQFYGTLLNLEDSYLVLKDPKNKKVRIHVNDVSLIRTAVKF